MMQMRDGTGLDPACRSGGGGNIGNQEMFGNFMVTSHESEGQGEDSKFGGRPENHAPVLSPVSGFLGIWSVVTSLKLSDVMGKMRG